MAALQPTTLHSMYNTNRFPSKKALTARSSQVTGKLMYLKNRWDSWKEATRVLCLTNLFFPLDDVLLLSKEFTVMFTVLIRLCVCVNGVCKIMQHVCAAYQSFYLSERYVSLAVLLASSVKIPDKGEHNICPKSTMFIPLVPPWWYIIYLNTLLIYIYMFIYLNRF